MILVIAILPPRFIVSSSPLPLYFRKSYRLSCASQFFVFMTLQYPSGYCHRHYLHFSLCFSSALSFYFWKSYCMYCSRFIMFITLQYQVVLGIATASTFHCVSSSDLPFYSWKSYCMYCSRFIMFI